MADGLTALASSAGRLAMKTHMVVWVRYAARETRASVTVFEGVRFPLPDKKEEKAWTDKCL